MVSIGSKHFSTTEYNTILPYLGSTGKSVRWWPSSVNSSKRSSASICCNNKTVFKNVLVYGGYKIRTKIITCFLNIICTIFHKDVLKTTKVPGLCLTCQICRNVSWKQRTENRAFRWLTLRRWTAFLVIRNAGGSGAFARKSSIREFTGANSLVWRQSSCNKQNNSI